VEPCRREIPFISAPIMPTGRPLIANMYTTRKYADLAPEKHIVKAFGISKKNDRPQAGTSKQNTGQRKRTAGGYYGGESPIPDGGDLDLRSGPFRRFSRCPPGSRSRPFVDLIAYIANAGRLFIVTTESPCL